MSALTYREKHILRRNGLGRVFASIKTAEFIAIIFFTLYYLLPSFSAKIPFIPMLFLQFVYMFFVFNTSRRTVKSKLLMYIILALYIAACYYFLTTTSSISTSVSNYNLKRFLSKLNQLLTGFFPVVILYRLNRGFNYKQLKMYLILISMLISFVVINSYQELQSNSTAARSWAFFDEQSEKNVATYSYVYAISALIPVLTQFVMHSQKKAFRISGAILIICLYLFLTNADYTLAVLIPAICSVVVFVRHTRSRITKAILIFCIPILMLVLPTVLIYFANLVDGDMKTRLLEVAQYLQGGGNPGYNLNGRLKLYRMSVEAFFSSPIIGNRSLGFDGHSTFLTALSDIGLIGAIPYFYLYHFMKKNTSAILGTKYANAFFFPTFLALILMGLTNPIHSAPALSFSVWLVVPLSILVFVHYNGENSVSKKETCGI